MNLDTLNRSDLFQEISELARAQGIATREEWGGLVEEVVDSHLDIGELDPDQNLTGLKELLHAMWDEYKRESQPESKEAVDEDPDAPHA
ncbi:hypothetical protein HY479_02795 [Candidatus Uhrbacteria bacterium]|nr:hypothetical protein [Candidatus Uhrbacteria bacterium]